MKPTYFLTITLLLLSSLLFITCKKDSTKNAKLPPATQEGKNTVGFTIDGEVWVPYAKCGFMSDPCREILARYGESGGAAPNGIDFGFTRIRMNSTTSSHLTITSSGGRTITTIGDKIDSIYVIFRGENSVGNSNTYSGPLSGSKFIITKLDKEAQIISGEFELILKENNGSGKEIVLKDGRFDFIFNACKCSK